MRVLTVEPGPNFSVADVHRGWSKALRQAGCQVVDAKFDNRLEFYEKAAKATGQTTDDALALACESLRATAYDFWPDLVLIVSAFYVNDFTLDVFRDRGITIVLLHTESPYEDDRQVERAQHVDLNVLNDPTNIDRYPPGTIYLPHAYDPDVHHPGPDGEPSDFCFVGTGYPSRVRFFEQVDWTGIDALLAGNWQWAKEDSPLMPLVAHDLAECLPNEEAARLYRGAKSSANLYRRESQRPELEAGWAMGPREVELAACGCFYLTEARGENREVLPMVPTFYDPEDFSEKLRWHLEHPEVREKIADEARAAVADRTFLSNVRRLLERVA